MQANDNEPLSVFLSYSRKDQLACNNLYSNLRSQGLDAKIDINDLPIGESIQESIIQLIVNSNYTLVLVSENSLQSSWVIWEIQRRRLLGGHQKSKLIPVYLDKTYLDDNHINSILTNIQKEIDRLADDALSLNRQGSPSNHLDVKKQSLFDFKGNFSVVVEYIRSTNSVDLSPENYLNGFIALHRAITGKSSLQNSNIIIPPLEKNTDIMSRINEIEFLVAEANFKEASKRTLDFVIDFYSKNISYRKKAIKISAKLHDSEKNLLNGSELMVHNIELAEEILSLIYEIYIPFANAA